MVLQWMHCKWLEVFPKRRRANYLKHEAILRGSVRSTEAGLVRVDVYMWVRVHATPHTKTVVFQPVQHAVVVLVGGSQLVACEQERCV